MNHPPRYDRLIIALNDDELEGFVREWALRKTEYLEVQRFTGPGDMGRDVVGYLSKRRHEGPWHNYQCKQYGKSLQTAVGLREIGKLLYFSFCGEFVPPTAYFFVTPRGVNRNLKRLIANPSKFRTELIITWDAYCANEISDGKNIPLDASLRTFIEAWDFSAIRALSVDDILGDAVVKPALYKWFMGLSTPQLDHSRDDTEQRGQPRFQTRQLCRLVRRGGPVSECGGTSSER